MSIYEDILYAINNLIVLEFYYDESYRLVEPHVLGVHNSKIQTLCYQLNGDSASGGIPEWRRFDNDSISNIVFSKERFTAPRSTRGGKHSVFDKKIAIANGIVIDGVELK